jgi:hypothetical protein
LIDRYIWGQEYLKKKIEKENSILIEKGNRMLADVVFYGNRNSDVICLKRKLRPYLLVYIIEK